MGRTAAKRKRTRRTGGMAAVGARRRERFSVAFVGKAAGNCTKAALIAGYSKRTAYSQGSRLLKHVEVQARIAELLSKKGLDEKTAIADAVERDGILSEIARGIGDSFARIQAVKELNKVEGRHSLTLHHKGRLTLEQALEEVAEAEGK